jgi:hypothetical protein
MAAIGKEGSHGVTRFNRLKLAKIAVYAALPLAPDGRDA